MKRLVATASLLASMTLLGIPPAMSEPLYITCVYKQKRLSTETRVKNPKVGVWVELDEWTWEPWQKLEEPRAITFTFNQTNQTGRYFDENRGYGFPLDSVHFLPDRILASNAGEEDYFFMDRRTRRGTWRWDGTVMQQWAGTCAKMRLVPTAL